MRKAAINIAWLRLQNGTLRVDLDTCEVFSLVRDQWKRLVFKETKDRIWNGVACSGGYFSTLLRAVIDGKKHRQRHYLHRIIWMARHGQELSTADHIDHGQHGKQCNHWSNLELVSISENMQRRSDRNNLAPNPQSLTDPYSYAETH